ncbi:MAG: hypothetical protein KF795_22840 [Labilithrix sp.]|nr:hypothetical protein [Labilithrix sp.]
MDADLLGTGLAEALELRAPKVPSTPDDFLDLEAAPTDDWFEVAETRRFRLLRKSKSEPEPRFLPFLNDALAFRSQGTTECRVDALWWRHRDDDGVRYLPSSSLKTDILVARRWLDTDREFDWLRRLCWLLDAAIEQMTGVTDIVIDLPPGVWGFAHQALVLAATLGRGQSLPSNYPRWHQNLAWRVAPWLVTTSDTNDLVMAIEYRLEAFERIPSLRLAVNRRMESWETTKLRIDPLLAGAITHIDLHRTVRFFDEDKTLRQIFRRGDVDLGTLSAAFDELAVRSADRPPASPTVGTKP